MQKLFIVLFGTDDGRDFDYLWQKERANVPQAWRKERADMLDMPMDAIDDAIIDIFEVKNAIHKDDVLKMINRYIVKPIQKQ